MSRFVSWLFTCLGIALLILVPFVAPETAFGDPGSDCFYSSLGKCTNDSNWEYCMGNGCSSCCGSDQNCLQVCAQMILNACNTKESCDTGQACFLKADPPNCKFISLDPCGTVNDKTNCGGCTCRPDASNVGYCGCQLK